MTIKLIVGLRNPGSAYAATRHNAGAWFVEALAKTKDLSFKTDKKLGGEWLRYDEQGLHAFLFLPTTFMNLNGAGVRAMAQFYDILPHEILIVHDELDLPVGDLRLKIGGGHGGHNGLRDVIQHLNASDFQRLRIGIGHPGHRDLVTDYVLTKPSSTDREKIFTAIARGLVTIPSILAGNFAMVMNQLHKNQIGE